MTPHPLAPVAPFEIGLAVQDMETSLGFYRDTFGLREISAISNPEGTAIKSGIGASSYQVVRLELATGERIKLFQPDRRAIARPRPSKPLDEAGFAFLTLIIEDLHAAASHLASAGYPMRREGIVELRPGVLVCLVDDPDGNVVELVEYQDLRSYRPETDARAG